jgi:transcriptional regulator with XRE-family HTH domain
MSIVNIVAQNIHKFRMQKGYSQEELGEMTGLHRTYIGSVERAERNISIINIDKIANALDVNIIELFKEIK